MAAAERPLRAKIAETTPLALITEQGENRNQLEKQWNLSCPFGKGAKPVPGRDFSLK